MNTTNNTAPRYTDEKLAQTNQSIRNRAGDIVKHNATWGDFDYLIEECAIDGRHVLVDHNGVVIRTAEDVWAKYPKLADGTIIYASQCPTHRRDWVRR